MRSCFTLLAFLITTSACTRSIVQNAPVEDVVTSSAPTTTLFIRTTHGLTFKVRGATMVGDSITGYSHAEGDVRRKRHAIAKSEVQTVSLRKPNGIATAGLIVSGGLLVMVALLASAPGITLGN